ncbi:Zn-dependent exopeptidase [Clathrospora elynae]|uniref:Carboxypeptidase M14B n=1 Tax=Clathrospora elynae TaxID=706981 RepID=A0A6A5S7Y1_9PLEO|nr:Zn-dependent exopeptidase [Clathrospora elynae]
MHIAKSSFMCFLSLHVGLIFADRYASNQNPVVVDTPQVTANFPDVEGIKLLSPAFKNPETVPGAFANGTSGPTPQRTLESFIPYVTLLNGRKGSKKLRIWIQGGQHGNEPAGDEGVLALLGKFANDTRWTVKVLEKADLLILPRYNVDGVEYLQQQLASNYDPNRDHAVLKRKQTRAIRQLRSNFDPHIFVDDHEYTGGNLVARSYIRAQDLLVSANKNQNFNPDIRALNQEFVDDVFSAAKSNGLSIFPYFTAIVTNGTITIEEPDATPAANHKGAGNYQSLTFLVETRGIDLADQHFQRRVASHLITLTTILNKAVNEFEAVYSTIENARKDFTESKSDIVVAYEQRVTNKTVQFINAANGSLVDVPVLSRKIDSYIITLSRSRPKAYVFSRAWTDVAERLRILGVKVDVLKQDFRGTVEALIVQTAQLAATKFEGIASTTVPTNATQCAVSIPAGGFWVDTKQINAWICVCAAGTRGRGESGVLY